MTTVPAGEASSPIPGPQPSSLRLSASAVPNRVGVCESSGPAGCPGHPAGSSVQYTVTVVGSGPAAVPDVVVRGSLAGQLADVDATQRVGDGGPVSPCAVEGAGEVQCELGSLPPGTTAVVAVVATVTSRPPDGTLVTRFEAAPGGGAFAPGSTVSADTAVTVTGTGGHGV